MSSAEDRLNMSLNEVITSDKKTGGRGDSKACYTCGKTGHLARDCRDKPQGASSDKACYTCGKTGHLASNCRSSSRRTKGRDDLPSFECYVCGGRGHFGRDCPSQPVGGGRGGGRGRGSGPRGSTDGGCHVCGDPDHFARDCPDNSNADSVCYKCQNKGHLARDCFARDTGGRREGKGRGGRGDECYSCGKTGHLARDCTRGRARSRSPGGRGGRDSRGGNADCKVYVGNLAFEVSWQDLKDHMRSVGRVVRADVLMGRDDRSRGCGVVEYGSRSEAQAAIDELTNTEIKGRKIFVREDREA